MFLFKNTSISTLVRSKFSLLKVITFSAVLVRKEMRREYDGNFRNEVLFPPIGFHTSALEYHFLPLN
jgi:hypothetical protein